jgi:hypothetical protein
MKYISNLIIIILFYISPLLSESTTYKYNIPGYDREALSIDDSFQSVKMDDYLYFYESENDYESFDELLNSNDYKRDILPQEKAQILGTVKVFFMPILE